MIGSPFETHTASVSVLSHPFSKLPWHAFPSTAPTIHFQLSFGLHTLPSSPETARAHRKIPRTAPTPSTPIPWTLLQPFSSGFLAHLGTLDPTDAPPTLPFRIFPPASRGAFPDRPRFGLPATSITHIRATPRPSHVAIGEPPTRLRSSPTAHHARPQVRRDTFDTFWTATPRRAALGHSFPFPPSAPQPPAPSYCTRSSP
jgi:hypothetical protein